jgi:hypothetical protein
MNVTVWLLCGVPSCGLATINHSQTVAVLCVLCGVRWCACVVTGVGAVSGDPWVCGVTVLVCACADDQPTQ